MPTAAALVARQLPSRLGCMTWRPTIRAVDQVIANQRIGDILHVHSYTATGGLDLDHLARDCLDSVCAIDHLLCRLREHAPIRPRGPSNGDLSLYRSPIARRLRRDAGDCCGDSTRVRLSSASATSFRQSLPLRAETLPPCFSRPSRRLRRLTLTLADAMKWEPARVAMGARTLGCLTARGRVVAVVLIALIIAAGIYRWVVFGNVNTLHGGSAAHTFTGESEVFPTSAEVQAGARSFASREGKVTHLGCRQVASYYTWSCSLHFAGGLTAQYRGVWAESQQTLGWSVLRRKASLHLDAPVGQ
jgi:hypothetical protein